MQAKLKCAIYTRVSTDNQAEVEFNSCEAQEEKIKAYIKSQEDMEVFKVYSDPGFMENLENNGHLFWKLSDTYSENNGHLIWFLADTKNHP